VERHGGHIDVESEPGEGTVFRVELPMQSGADDEQAQQTVELPDGAHLLLVDDDERVRRASVSMLRYLGFDVVAAASGDEAVAAFERARSEGAPFAGVILDLTMVGGEDGVATLGRLRSIDPRVRALVSSGYSDGAESMDFAHYGFVGSLPKPYTIRQLTAALSQLLGD
jgi:CheY-like chemotaxis protein